MAVVTGDKVQPVAKLVALQKIPTFNDQRGGLADFAETFVSSDVVLSISDKSIAPMQNYRRGSKHKMNFLQVTDIWNCALVIITSLVA